MASTCLGFRVHFEAFRAHSYDCNLAKVLERRREREKERKREGEKERRREREKFSNCPEFFFF